jgi:hypothetical protein
MAAFNKFNIFVQDMARKKHALNSDVLKVMLSNTLPLAANAVKGDITEIGAGNGYTAGGLVAAYVSDNDTAGLYKLVLSPPAFTAAGGNIGPFQYAVLYNSTAAGLNLIGWWDYGVALTLTNGNTFTVALDQTNGTLTVQ